jgi:hypothetical protein
MRTWSISLAIYCIACTSAVACTIHGAGPSIVFEQVPTDIRFYSSEIIEASIHNGTQVSDAAGRPVWLLDARVDRVIKGSINTNTVKIFFYQFCGAYSGGHGIILGELEDDPLHGPVLIPKYNWVVR